MGKVVFFCIRENLNGKEKGHEATMLHHGSEEQYKVFHFVCIKKDYNKYHYFRKTLMKLSQNYEILSNMNN